MVDSTQNQLGRFIKTEVFQIFQDSKSIGFFYDLHIQWLQKCIKGRMFNNSSVKYTVELQNEQSVVESESNQLNLSQQQYQKFMDHCLSEISKNEDCSLRNKYLFKRTIDCYLIYFQIEQVNFSLLRDLLIKRFAQNIPISSLSDQQQDFQNILKQHYEKVNLKGLHYLAEEISNIKTPFCFCDQLVENSNLRQSLHDIIEFSMTFCDFSHLAEKLIFQGSNVYLLRKLKGDQNYLKGSVDSEVEDFATSMSTKLSYFN